MQRHAKRLVSVVLCVVFFISSAAAQPHDWSAVQRLAHGRDIWIETRQGEKYHGNLVTVGDNEMVIWSDEPDSRAGDWWSARSRATTSNVSA